LCIPMKVSDYVANIMSRDDEYVLMKEGDEQTFLFGQKTVDGLFTMRFGCQRCGRCCENENEKCGELEMPDERLSCGIHGESRFPIACYTYPFMVDETATEGWGKRIRSRYDPFRRKSIKEGKPDYVYYEFGLMNNMTTLVIPPVDPAWGNGETLKEYYIRVLTRLSEAKETDVLQPPVLLCSAYSSGSLSDIRVEPEELKRALDEASANMLKNIMSKKQAILDRIEIVRKL